MMWGWPVALLMSLSMGLSMAELASAFPTSGALYYWSYRLAPPRLRNLACWVTAWTLTVGQAAFSASSFFIFVQFMQAAIMQQYGIAMTPLQRLAALAALVATVGVLNCGSARLTAFMTTLGTLWNILALSALCVAVLLAVPERKTAEYVFTSWESHSEITGITSPMYTILVGLLMSQFTFTGYDGSAHVAEETLDAEVNVPYGILYSILATGAVGYLYMASLTFVRLDETMRLDTLTPGDNLVLQILVGVSGGSANSTRSAVALFSIPMVAAFFCSYQGLANNSRMLYAFARDHGVPFSHYAKKVHPVTKAPVYSVLYMIVLATSLALPMCFNDYAFPVITSFSVLACYCGYVIPVLCKLSTGHRFFLQGPFQLRPTLSYANNLVSAGWVLMITVLATLPTAYPVTAANCNWSGPSLVATEVLVLIGYYFPKYGARYWFKGPRTNLGQFQDVLPSDLAAQQPHPRAGLAVQQQQLLLQAEQISSVRLRLALSTAVAEKAAADGAARATAAAALPPAAGASSTEPVTAMQLLGTGAKNETAAEGPVVEADPIAATDLYENDGAEIIPAAAMAATEQGEHGTLPSAWREGFRPRMRAPPTLAGAQQPSLTPYGRKPSGGLHFGADAGPSSTKRLSPGDNAAARPDEMDHGAADTCPAANTETLARRATAEGEILVPADATTCTRSSKLRMLPLQRQPQSPARQVACLASGVSDSHPGGPDRCSNEFRGFTAFPPSANSAPRSSRGDRQEAPEGEDLPTEWGSSAEPTTSRRRAGLASRNSPAGSEVRTDCGHAPSGGYGAGAGPGVLGSAERRSGRGANGRAVTGVARGPIAIGSASAGTQRQQRRSPTYEAVFDATCGTDSDEASDAPLTAPSLLGVSTVEGRSTLPPRISMSSTRAGEAEADASADGRSTAPTGPFAAVFASPLLALMHQQAPQRRPRGTSVSGAEAPGMGCSPLATVDDVRTLLAGDRRAAVAAAYAAATGAAMGSPSLSVLEWRQHCPAVPALQEDGYLPTQRHSHYNRYHQHFTGRLRHHYDGHSAEGLGDINSSDLASVASEPPGPIGVGSGCWQDGLSGGTQVVARATRCGSRISQRPGPGPGLGPGVTPRARAADASATASLGRKALRGSMSLASIVVRRATPAAAEPLESLT